METTQFQSVLHVGDVSCKIIYYVDFLSEMSSFVDARGFAVRWEQFFYQIEPIASAIPYMVCIGNHEYDYLGQPFKPTWSNAAADSGGECGIPFERRFQVKK